MFDNYTQDQLENLRTFLTLFGTGATLAFGIIGTSFETHDEATYKKKGKEIKRRKPNRWFYIAIIGLIISSLITGSSYFVGDKIDKIKDKEDKAYKDRREKEERAFQRHQDSVSIMLDSNLRNSLKLTENFKKSSEKALGGLETNLNSQGSNLNTQSKLLDRTSKLISHPFFPFRLEMTITMPIKFDFDDDREGWAEIKNYLLNGYCVNKPKDLLIDKDQNTISYGGNIPFDALDTNGMDKKLYLLRNYLYWKLLPNVKFYVYKTPSLSSYKDALYFLMAGSMTEQKRNILKDHFNYSNCDIAFKILYNENKVTFGITVPTVSTYQRIASDFNSLYEFKDSYFTLTFTNIEGVSLENAKFLMGSNSQTLDFNFENSDLIKNDLREKIYRKNVFKP